MRSKTICRQFGRKRYTGVRNNHFACLPASALSANQSARSRQNRCRAWPVLLLAWLRPIRAFNIHIRNEVSKGLIYVCLYGCCAYRVTRRWVETHPTFVETTPGQTPIRAFGPDSARPPHGGRFASLMAERCNWCGSSCCDVAWANLPID